MGVFFYVAGFGIFGRHKILCAPCCNSHTFLKNLHLIIKRYVGHEHIVHHPSQMWRRRDVACHPEASRGFAFYICTYFCTRPPLSCKGFPDLMQKLRSPHLFFKWPKCMGKAWPKYMGKGWPKYMGMCKDRPKPMGKGWPKCMGKGWPKYMRKGWPKQLSKGWPKCRGKGWPKFMGKGKTIHYNFIVLDRAVATTIRCLHCIVPFSWTLMFWAIVLIMTFHIAPNHIAHGFPLYYN